MSEVTRMSKLKYILSLINDFSHDMFTGLATCGLTAILWVKYYFHLPAAAENLTAAENLLLLNQFLLNHLGRLFSWMFLGASVIVILTGFFRLKVGRISYPSYPAESQELMGVRRNILILKHILLGGFFIFGGFISLPFLF